MRVLEALEEDDPLQPTLRTFELDLLQQLGYGVDFSVQVSPWMTASSITLRHNPGFMRCKTLPGNAHGSIRAWY